MLETAETFSPDAYLASLDSVLLGTKAGRRILTRLDPLAFAIVYLRKHLTNDDGDFTMADFHLDLVEQAKQWVRPVTGPIGPRDAYIAPRDSGKSTWLFLVMLMWSAAHGHVKFAAAFADSADQAEGHLSTFRNELNSNVLLREDFPDLCSPKRRPGGMTVADRQNSLFTKSGFVLAARGIESGVLGLKVGELRPDLLILDDVEPGESKYSAFLMEKRLKTLQDVILPLNARARVVISGTVTMSDSIVHQLAKSARGQGVPETWIADEKITAHYYPPIALSGDGTSERSSWPDKWPLDFLTSIRHTRAYLKNFANDPIGAGGGFWTLEDFDHHRLDSCTRWTISVDPAVTTGTGSDYTGIAVVGYSPTANRALVVYATQVKLSGSALRTHLIGVTVAFPLARVLLVESNQGGQLWKDVFHHFPIKVVTVHQSIKKEVRAAMALAFYQRGQVSHVDGLTALEEQQVAFPDAPHDDMVDSVVSAVLQFLKPKPTKRSSINTDSYV